MYGTLIWPLLARVATCTGSLDLSRNLLIVGCDKVVEGVVGRYTVHLM